MGKLLSKNRLATKISPLLNKGLTEEMNVDYERAIKSIQNRIDDGFMWVVGKGKQGGNRNQNFVNHPYAS